MQVLSIQDLSCMGKCSLTVALPILSAMGISTSVLPTAVLSTHTGFPAPQVQPMTENLLPFAEHIASVGIGLQDHRGAFGYLFFIHQLAGFVLVRHRAAVG